MRISLRRVDQVHRRSFELPVELLVTLRSIYTSNYRKLFQNSRARRVGQRRTAPSTTSWPTHGGPCRFQTGAVPLARHLLQPRRATTRRTLPPWSVAAEHPLCTLSRVLTDQSVSRNRSRRNDCHFIAFSNGGAPLANQPATPRTSCASTSAAGGEEAIMAPSSGDPHAPRPAPPAGAQPHPTVSTFGSGSRPMLPAGARPLGDGVAGVSSS